MPLRNTAERWGTPSIALHWVTALAVLGLLVVGFTMDSLPNTPFKRDVYLLHKSLGLTVGGLTVLRLLWRWLQPTPALPDGTSRVQRLAATAGHAGLYALLLVMPASGLLYNWASNFATPWFGITVMARAGQVDRELKAISGEVHEIAGLALAALLLAHAGAAFWHHYRLRDRVLWRMAPWIRPPA